MAESKWIPRWPGHPDLTFEDLRAGRIPKPSLLELAARQKAIEEARGTRLDISPLTTQELIREIRDSA